MLRKLFLKEVKIITKRDRVWLASPILPKLTYMSYSLGDAL
jgi:hypothetical protein